jgi:hypothetical protein
VDVIEFSTRSPSQMSRCRRRSATLAEWLKAGSGGSYWEAIVTSRISVVSRLAIPGAIFFPLRARSWALDAS